MIKCPLRECTGLRKDFFDKEIFKVEVVKIIITVLFLIDCLVLTFVILMQEGKSAGLGSIAGGAETYWGKNKGRSMEGALEKITKILAVVFFVAALVLDLKWLN